MEDVIITDIYSLFCTYLYDLFTEFIYSQSRIYIYYPLYDIFYRKYSPLTTNCKCAMEHQIFYQEESENFPNFHQSAAGTWLNQWLSVWMGWTTATCHHVKLLQPQPGWLGNLWSILVPAAGESWTTIGLGMRLRVTWCNYE